ncbi:MAG: xanthine dehydrogenase small subunit [Ignavibacteria bacterium]|nr:MAG: xanthine dehydrogenase small subunit [Ignavibacteria bacterium]KAF0159125.1 MAG: xanthine dehydrogenase small subunit [Ignavibacteria bacterium]
MIEFILNNQTITTDLSPTTVLLDFIRKESKLNGTKEGCREGDCGACTVLIGSLEKSKVVYKSVNSCLVPLSAVHAKHIATVEGLTPSRNNTDDLSPIQNAIVDEGGTQCGFCTPGFVVSMTSYFLNEINPNVKDAVNSIGGNICRCTGYTGIVRALKKTIAAIGETKKDSNHYNRLIEASLIPEYFFEMPKRLKLIKEDIPKSKADFLIGGGTDLYVQRWEELVQSNSEFVSSKKISGEIKIVNSKIVFGGACTIQQVLESKIIKKYFPSLQNKLELFGSLPIRNRATIAGNIVNASPIGDMTNILTSLNADVHLVGKTKRTIQLKNFYLGYKTLAKKKDELVASVSMNIPTNNFFFNYEKVSKRTYLDIASVNSSISLVMKKGKIETACISAGGVAPIPLYLEKSSNLLLEKEISTQLVKDCAETAMQEISPISDARGTADYKRLLLRQLIYSHFLMLFPKKINVGELL